MVNFSQALDQALEKYGISAKWLSEQSGVSQQMISQFRNGKQRIYSDSLEKVVDALPGEVRVHFFSLLGGSGSLEAAIADMSDAEASDLLMLLARRFSTSSGHKSSTLVGVS